ncbi:MAG: hypothetical protein ACJA01_002274 [Saprospiraceae bacterium]|jgi:hypothetical protein
MKYIKRFLLLIFLLLIIAAIYVFYFTNSIKPTINSSEKNPYEFSVNRILDEPIIHKSSHQLLEEETASIGYANINGPSLIRVPSWIDNPLGQYYLYFAHHKGSYIKLAFSDTITGPWTVYDHPILPLSESGLVQEEGADTDLSTLIKYTSWSESLALIEVGDKAIKAYESRNQNKIKAPSPTTPHLASPEVIIDNKTQQIRMYYHGIVDGSLQMSKVAISEDGLKFKANPEIISLPYLRMFQIRGNNYGLAMPGFLYKTKDGLTDFHIRNKWIFDTDVRHSDVYVDGNSLWIYYSKVGDAPERIYYAHIDVSSDDWNDWELGPSKELLRPELEWEGTHISSAPSYRGEISKVMNQIRDPHFFKDKDGKMYLLYTGSGEQAIGIVELKTNNK